MSKWRAGLLGLTLTSTLVLSANAADTYRGGLKDGPPPPVYVAAPIWTGFYVGVNGGYGWTANDGVNDGWGGEGSARLSPSGGFGGGQIGYNWQGLFGYSPWVIGIEADIQGAGISANAQSNRFVDYGFYTQENSLNWFGTVRGRLGYAYGATLFYATGGVAFGEVEAKYGPGASPFNATETQNGWVVGGGIEYKFNPAWSFKGEYQFIDLDASDVNGAGPLNGSVFSDRSEVNTFRVGLNYTLGNGWFGRLNRPASLLGGERRLRLPLSFLAHRSVADGASGQARELNVPWARLENQRTSCETAHSPVQNATTPCHRT